MLFQLSTHSAATSFLLRPCRTFFPRMSHLSDARAWTDHQREPEANGWLQVSSTFGQTNDDDGHDIDDLSNLHQYWRQRLHELSRPSAVALIPMLSRENAIGFTNKVPSRGTLVDYVVREKELHPERLLLVRVGEFYESFGVDALMLVQYAGLNPMGQKCRAGCPVQNLQQVLNDLTAAGLTVAVYEEIAPAGHGSGEFRKLKRRALAQVVSLASPVYMHEACISRHEIAYTEPPPYVGICFSANGFIVVQVHVDSRVCKTHQRMTAAALKAFLSSNAFAPPLLVDVQPSHLQMLPTGRRTLRAARPDGFAQAMLEYVAEQVQLSPADFRQMVSSDWRGGASGEQTPCHLYLSTATQIGLLPMAGIPDLPKTLLPSNAPLASEQLLRRWLLLPPPPRIADAIHLVCENLRELDVAFPVGRPLPVGKLVALISARQGNPNLFHDIRHMLYMMRAALGQQELEMLNAGLLELVEFEAGHQVTLEELQRSADYVTSLIEAIVYDPSTSTTRDKTSASSRIQVRAFFEKNEEGFRCLVRSDAVELEYAQVSRAAAALQDVIDADMRHQYELEHDVTNNALHFKRAKRRPVRKIPTEESPDTTMAEQKDEARIENEAQDSATRTQPVYEAARDRNRRLLADRHTTDALREAIGNYLGACAEAQSAVKLRLQTLCEELQAELRCLESAAQWTLLASTLVGHVASATGKGWTLPSLRPAGDCSQTLELEEMFPYWLNSMTATKNSFTWEGIWLLTAPNMAGKSTLMRATTVVALLANVGLLAPIKRALVPRYDSYFLRTASFDIPAEGKSSFAQEMDDLNVLTHECTRRSLVMLDEIGRGTSTCEGAALGAALLEWLDQRGMCAMYSTHLHEINTHLSSMPSLRSLHRRCLHATTIDGKIRMLYKVEQGVCTDSLAVHSARVAGLPEQLLDRMQHLVDQSVSLKSRSSCVIPAVECAKTAASNGDDTPDNLHDDQLMKVGEVLKEVTGTNHFIHVPCDHQPPPRLSGRSCVYVLQLRPMDGNVDPRKGLLSPLYVGESDSIFQRLEQHRIKRRQRARVDCVLVEVESKTEARTFEAHMISRLKGCGLGRVTNIVRG